MLILNVCLKTQFSPHQSICRCSRYTVWGMTSKARRWFSRSLRSNMPLLFNRDRCEENWWRSRTDVSVRIPFRTSPLWYTAINDAPVNIYCISMVKLCCNTTNGITPVWDGQSKSPIWHQIFRINPRELHWRGMHGWIFMHSGNF